MAIVINSGLLAAVASVSTFFTAAGVTANVSCGWKKDFRQDNQGTGGANRVVFTPAGDDKGGGGKLVPARLVGNRFVRDPLAVDPTIPVGAVRSLLEWERSVLVSVWAVDLTNREVETAQIEAVEDLFEWTVRAVHSAPGAFANVVWGDVTWIPPKERAFGLEMRAGLTFRHPIFDSPRTIVYPTVAVVARGAGMPAAGTSTGGDT